MKRYLIMSDWLKVLDQASHFEEAKHKLDTVEDAYLIYDTKKGYIRMLNINKVNEKLQNKSDEVMEEYQNSYKELGK